ncbi:MAG: DUF5678 domain-containing protein [Bryobacteraceae bacterium]
MARQMDHTGVARTSPKPTPLVRRVPYIDRTKEMKWIHDHRKEYADKWVALDGDQLIAAADDGQTVFRAADARGISRPFVVHMDPADPLPFAGW